MRYDTTHPRYLEFKVWERIGLNRTKLRHVDWVDPSSGTVCEWEQSDGVIGRYKCGQDGEPLKAVRRGNFFVHDLETGEIDPVPIGLMSAGSCFYCGSDNTRWRTEGPGTVTRVCNKCGGEQLAVSNFMGGFKNSLMTPAQHEAAQADSDASVALSKANAERYR